MTKEEMLRLLGILNERLSKEEVTGEIYLMGGAVMCLAFNARESTKDLDCYFIPAIHIRKIAEEIAQEEDLDSDWLNDGVKGFLSPQASFTNFLTLSHLRVLAASAEYLLAMKSLSMRLGAEFQDENDVRFLLRYLNITEFKKAVEVITRYYPKEQFPQKTFYALEEILGHTA